MEQFLSPHAWIDHLHSDTLELTDLSTFWCLVWCEDSRKIPHSKELCVAEPPSFVMDDPLPKDPTQGFPPPPPLM